MPKFVSSGLSALRFAFQAVGGYSVLTGLSALAAVILAICAPRSLAAELAMIVPVLFLVTPVSNAVRSKLSGGRPLLMGTATMPRLMILMAALANAFGGGPASGMTVIAVALAAFMVVLEEAMRRPVRQASPQAANIPGWAVPLPSYSVANTVYAADVVAMLLVAASVVFEWSQVPALLVCGIGLIFSGLVAFQAVRYLLRRRRFEAALPEILDDLSPHFAFHWHAPAGTAYQAAMWLPYLDRIGVPYFVLVRTAGNFAEVTKLTTAPVLLRPGLEDLDPVVRPSLKAVFYVNTAVRNSHMIRFPQLTHIQLNHGDSDKIASVSPTFRQYDKNFVAGPAAVDRFAKHGVLTRADQFEIVGRPQLELVEPAKGPISQVDKPTVLYSPTWSGFYDDSDYSSLPAGADIVAALLARGCTVIFRPHPYARRHKGNAAACEEIISMLEADARTSGRAHVFGPDAETGMTVSDCFNAADAMFSDVSSLVSDFLSSGKPFAMAAVSAHGDAFVDEFPLAQAAYVFDMIEGRAVGLDALLDDLLGADSILERRRELRDYYLGSAPAQDMVEHFVSTARRFL